MIIHFICSGNTYRSRLAEAYLNSKKLDGIKAISSGINATELAIYPIRWYTEKLSEENNLEKFMAPSWQQTTSALLKDNDLVVFLSHDIYDNFINLKFKAPLFEVWDIPDVDLRRTDIEIIKDTKEAFTKIKNEVDRLLKNIKTL